MVPTSTKVVFFLIFYPLSTLSSHLEARVGIVVKKYTSCPKFMEPMKPISCPFFYRMNFSISTTFGTYKEGLRDGAPDGVCE